MSTKDLPRIGVPLTVSERQAERMNELVSQLNLSNHEQLIKLALAKLDERYVESDTSIFRVNP